MIKKREIIDITGKKKAVSCLGCAIAKGKVESPGGSITTTRYFDAQQDFEIPIPGFVILASKRHVQSIDEFTAAEREDFINFLCLIRKGMREALRIETVYVVQEEDTAHHFYVWLFPRYKWMQKQFGTKIQSVRPIMEYAREYMKTNQNLKEVEEATKKLREYFNNIDKSILDSTRISL